ncbi:MAG TPA: hypothetical protein DCQ99_03530 [Nitrospinae bacterium]|nr:MAG: hypothetical protein A3C43_07720 [Candidatus Schekmanbacteria bacterium RIFCSPHIGHO2_02_FULL_38_11]HAP66885.1 hypothetical protein [Nitrospinota bacterium]HBA27322.1 hypothetical protein [Nitrospinota bacterium]
MTITLEEKVEAILKHLQRTAVERCLDDGKRVVRLVEPSCSNCKKFINRGGECEGDGHILYPGCDKWIYEESNRK